MSSVLLRFASLPVQRPGLEGARVYEIEAIADALEQQAHGRQLPLGIQFGTAARTVGSQDYTAKNGAAADHDGLGGSGVGIVVDNMHPSSLNGHGPNNGNPGPGNNPPRQLGSNRCCHGLCVRG